MNKWDLWFLTIWFEPSERQIRINLDFLKIYYTCLASSPWGTCFKKICSTTLNWGLLLLEAIVTYENEYAPQMCGHRQMLQTKVTFKLRVSKNTKES